jgi:predicted alpha/beta hydrolase
MEIKELKYRDSLLKTTIFPCKTNKGSVLIAPAMGITAKYYTPLATWLCEHGFNVMILDYLGTGFSGSENIKDSTATFKDWVQNIEIAGRDLKESNLTLPLVFLGHSIGSQLFGFIEDTKLFDKAVFIASSTGYWKDGRSPQRWINYLLLKVIIPFSNLIWGYTNAQFFKQGQNYPKYPSLQWRKWCLNKEYLKMELNDNQANNFNLYKGKISSLWFTDDPVANDITAPKLVAIYKNANTSLIKLAPSDCNAVKIGHSGFLSRKFKDTLWRTILNNLI